MTPLGHGILTGMSEVDDPLINDAMTKMMATASTRDLNQTVLDLAALATALCNALGECSNTSAKDVLDCVLAR
jgi:hypothetical protein